MELLPGAAQYRQYVFSAGNDLIQLQFAHINRVNALAWDEIMSILYIGGSFHAVGDASISAGLAMWSKHTGLIDFPGGGVLHSDGGVSNTQVKALAYEPRSEVRYSRTIFIGNHSTVQLYVLIICNMNTLSVAVYIWTISPHQ